MRVAAARACLPFAPRTAHPHVFFLATLLFLTAAHSPLAADPRPPEPMDAAELKVAIQKLQVTGTALYVAAHPDDENTAFITWLSRGRKVRTGYLSMTRGDGGQNLIGTETGDRLGVLRTQELLAARRIDGGEQFFTRALDFGFSKTSEETMEKWGRDRILSDVVWVIRRFRPDVIVTRFPTNGDGGHGHHTASAILAEEAFTAAADSSRFPEQLRWVRPWRAKRLVWNVFRFGSQGADTTRGRVRVDLGEYSAALGRSFTEIAGESRSMHKSQGFGAAERRGTWINTFEHRLGERASGDLFDGVDLTWGRIRDGERLQSLFERANRAFDPERPEVVLPALLEAWDVMAKLDGEPVVVRKREELLEVIRSCAGLWLEATAAQHLTTPGGRVRVVASALARRSVDVHVPVVTLRAGGVMLAERKPDWTLGRNEPRSDTAQVTLPATLAASGPYWLARRPLPGAADVADQTLIGTPENAPALTARFTVQILRRTLTFETPVVHRWVDPVQGERYRDLVIAPPALLRFDHGAYLFPDSKAREVRVNVQSADRAVQGQLSLELPAGWSAEPRETAVALRAGQADTTLRFLVTPGRTPAAATVAARFFADGAVSSSQIARIDYGHVPIQTLLPPAEARLVRTDLEAGRGRVGYVMGSGDQGPEALAQMGFTVALLSDDELENADLTPFDAIVTGVRAYNTRPRLIALQPRLLGYVAGGGRLVVQYNTAEEGLQDRLGPWPFRISRDRVTVEEAEMRLLDGKHPLLSRPNAIGAADFAGWVQERGLYYARPFDTRYDTLIVANDPGDAPRSGGLLHARHGKGEFIYTGLAFFRQLPAGVPGAWRLFANLVSRKR